MKKMVLVGALVLVGCQGGNAAFEGSSFGEPVTLTATTELVELSASPERWVGETVLVEGTVSDVCTHMGCWMQLVPEAGAEPVRIQVEDGVIVFPTEATGKRARVQGTVERIDQTSDHAREAAEEAAAERGEDFDPAESYQIRATGAVIAGLETAPSQVEEGVSPDA